MSDVPMRPPSHVTGDRGERRAALAFVEWGWTADRIQNDYGEDLDCNIFIEGRRTYLHFRCQVKSTTGSSYARRLASGQLAVSIAGSVLRAWTLSFFPVLLVVYDEQDDNLYWTDATGQLRSRPQVLASDQATLYVDPASVLSRSRQEVQDCVQRFYTDLLRLDRARLECDVYPLLMPYYYGCPVLELGALRDVTFQSGEVEVLATDKEQVPAWLTTVRTLEPDWRLKGVRLSAEGAELGAFTRALEDYLLQARMEVPATGWLAYVCSPIRIEAEGEDVAAEPPWVRELVPWWSYSIIGGHTVADFDHALRPPNGFVQGRRIRSGSWSGAYDLDPVRDLVLEMAAAVATTPSYRNDVKAHARYLARQFMPWQCPTDRLGELRAALREVSLSFAALEETVASETVAGVITAPYVNLSVGVWPGPGTWEEYEAGGVEEHLRAAGLLSRLPGTPGPDDVRDQVAARFPGVLMEPAERVSITRREYIAGMPIDHSGREVCLSRLRCVDNPASTLAEEALTRACAEISAMEPRPIEVGSSLELYDESWHPAVHGVSIWWRPTLTEAAGESVERVMSLVEQAFNSIWPQADIAENQVASSHAILCYAGQIAFEDLDLPPVPTQ